MDPLWFLIGHTTSVPNMQKPIRESSPKDAGIRRTKRDVEPHPSVQKAPSRVSPKGHKLHVRNVPMRSEVSRGE